jgi:hypothetical protein
MDLCSYGLVLLQAQKQARTRKMMKQIVKKHEMIRRTGRWNLSGPTPTVTNGPVILWGEVIPFWRFYLTGTWISAFDGKGNSRRNTALESGWPDVFVKKSPKDNEKLPKKSPNHLFVRFTI